MLQSASKTSLSALSRTLFPAHEAGNRGNSCEEAVQRGGGALVMGTADLQQGLGTGEVLGRLARLGSAAGAEALQGIHWR